MYLPPQFNSTDLDAALDLMRQTPLASLISVGDDGLPFVSHLPLAATRHGEQLTLLGHCARANPHWRLLQARADALVTFLGPQAYLSPSFYPDRQRVPSWNYLALHCRVQATLIEQPEAKDALLKQLIAIHEPAYAAQWRSLDTTFTAKMLAGMVGFELRVTAWQGKFKLNQHRPESHAAMHAAYAAGSAPEVALAHWMERLGLIDPETEVDAKK